MNDRFEKDETIYSFGDLFYVICPRCNGCGKVYKAEENSDFISGLRRFICDKCGTSFEQKPGSVICYGQIKNNKAITIGGNFDWYFGFPLYLQTKCCGNTLWAYNEDHLNFLEEYVEAKHRFKGKGNKSLASRLPKWIKEAKNREEILKRIKSLREKFKDIE